MKDSIYLISIPDLLISLIPVLIVIAIYYYWKLRVITVFYAAVRMIFQLLAIGFILTFIFETKNIYIICGILFFMLIVAAWISLRPTGKRKEKFLKAFISLFIGCVSILALIVFVIIRPDPWYNPTYLIPLAGMLFANSMNALSLAAERFQKEIKDGNPYPEAKKTAFIASLIPVTNMFFAVGLVSLPGMMTGQILAGVDPLIAVRYQILIMATLFGAAGISSSIYLSISRD